MGALVLKYRMEFTLLIVSAFITSSISAVLGMGGGIILLGIMAIIIPEGFMVIALHGVIQLVSNITRTYVFRKHLVFDIIKRFFIGAAIGLLTSAMVIITIIYTLQLESGNDLKVDFLKPLIGLFILWYLFLKGPKKEKNLSFVWVGGISGISSVFIGATGPLIAPFFLSGNLTKENIIASKAACQVISHLGKIPLFIILFNVNYIAEMSTLLPLVISVFIGTNVGKQVLGFIPENIFRMLFKSALFLIALKLIIYS